MSKPRGRRQEPSKNPPNSRDLKHGRSRRHADILEPPPESGQILAAQAARKNGALPEDCDAPARLNQALHRRGVSSDIGIEFPLPEVCPRPGRGSVPATVVTVPEAAVHEDSNPEAWQHDIGAPRKIPPMQAEPESESVQLSPDGQLDCGVLSPNAGHQATALLGSHDVGTHVYLPVRSP